MSELLGQLLYVAAVNGQRNSSNTREQRFACMRFCDSYAQRDRLVPRTYHR